MVGQVCDVSKVLDEERLRSVVEKALGASWTAASCELRAAADGLTGFLGDHFRAVAHLGPLCVVTAADHDGRTTTLRLFAKSLPLTNQSKAEFIVSNNFFRREELMFQVFEEIGGDEGPNPWRPKAYLYTDCVLVMPDLAPEGFAPKHFLDTLDLPHVLTVAASVARFHAAFANYTTKRTTDPLKPFNFLEEHKEIMTEPTLCDSPWLRAAAKLSANFLNTFSAKYKNTIPELEPKLLKLYLEASDSLREYSDTLNVLIHRDLWMNNILFGKDNAILVDYQCVRFAPPAFDITILLYLTTTREFRDAHEKEVFLHYYSVFTNCLDEATRLRMKQIGYDEEEFLRCCELSRMFGSFYALAIFPYVLLEPGAARRLFDDPRTYERYCNQDRSEPVLGHAKRCRRYRTRQLRATEEFVDRYLLKKETEQTIFT